MFHSSRVSQERLTAIAAVAAITAHVTTGSFASVGLVSVPIGLVRVGPVVGLLLNGTVLGLGAAVCHRRC
jgi:hypothetical protein